MVEDRSGPSITFNFGQLASPETPPQSFMKDPPFVGKKGALQPFQRVPPDANPKINETAPDHASPDMNRAHPDTPAPAHDEDSQDEPGTKAGNPDVHPDRKEGDADLPGNTDKGAERPAAPKHMPEPSDTPTDYPADPGHNPPTEKVHAPARRGDPGVTGQPGKGQPGYRFDGIGSPANPSFFPSDPGHSPVRSKTPELDPHGDPGTTGPLGNPQPGIVLRGYAMNTAHPGNGIHFRHDGVADLSGHPEVHFNVTHDRNVSNIAGTTKMTHAMKFKAAMGARKLSQAAMARLESETMAGKTPPAVDEADFEEYTTLENAVLLGFEAALHPNAPGYEAAKKAMAYLTSVGKVPNVSVNIKGKKMSYDAATDRVYMDGPYGLVHLAFVDKGAFDDSVGVGVYSAEPQNMDVSPKSPEAPRGPARVQYAAAQLASDESMVKAFMGGKVSFAECSITLANESELVEAFLADESVPMHARARLAKIHAKERNALPSSSFACPSDRSFPIHDAAHVRNALSRINQKHSSACSKESMLARIHSAAKKHGVKTDNSFQVATDADGVEYTLETDVATGVQTLHSVDSETSYIVASGSTSEDASASLSGDINMPNPPTKVVVAADPTLMARIAALEAREQAVAEATLNTLRGQLVADYGLPLEALGVYKTADQLDGLRVALASAKGNPLPRPAPTDPAARQRANMPAKRPHELFEEAAFDAADWTSWREGQRTAILSGKNAPAVI